MHIYIGVKLELMISLREVMAFSTMILLISSAIRFAPPLEVFADSSDVSNCSGSFSGTLSEPFNAETLITINSVTGDYDVEFDYAFAVGEEGTIAFLKSSALEPSTMTLVEGETISTILTSGESILDGVMKLYHQDISDCDILFDSSNIPDSKRIVLPTVSITDLEPSKFLVKAAIPDAESAKDFTKLVIAYVTNPEASVSYNIRNVTIVTAPDSGPTVFCGRNIEDFDNVIDGTNGSDELEGTGASDLIRGFGGDDDIRGRNGNDCLVGGPGDDLITGGNGDDQLFGNDGNDRLFGNAGKDIISGGDGDDYIAGKSGNDNVFGNDGNDKMFGNEGNDFVKGGDGDDAMYGGDGDDKLAGNTGEDRMSGQNGDDYLLGGRGDDRLRGGDGLDELDGGKDRDKCYDVPENFEAIPPVHCEQQIVAKDTVIYTDPDPFESINPDFNINQVGLTTSGNAFLTVHGTAGGTQSTTPGIVFFYFIQISDGPDDFGDPDRYVITSHGGVEDSTEVVDDLAWHAHRIISLENSEVCSPFGDGVEIVLAEDGTALVTPDKVVLEGVKPRLIYEVATGQLDISAVDGHVCVTHATNFDIITIPDV